MIRLTDYRLLCCCAAVLLSLERKYIAKETWLLYLNYAAHRLSSVGITLRGDEGNSIQSYANQVKAGRSDSILSNIPISNPYMDTGHTQVNIPSDDIRGFRNKFTAFSFSSKFSVLTLQIT